MSNYSVKEHLEVLKILNQIKAEKSIVYVHRPSMERNIQTAKKRLELIKSTLAARSGKAYVV